MKISGKGMKMSSKRMKMSIAKKVCVVTSMCMVAILTFAGCEGYSENEQKECTSVDTNQERLTPEQTEVIVVGESIVYLDEVRYYAYNTQATYEAYYIAEEKELDWSREMGLQLSDESSQKISLEKAVKSTVLDRICEREVMVTYAEKYKVELSGDEQEEIADKVQTFFDETNKKLLEKIDVTQERLKIIYEKDAIAEKVKTLMESEKEGKSEETYKNWKTVNNVTTNGYWEEINYNEPIFDNSSAMHE